MADNPLGERNLRARGGGLGAARGSPCRRQAFGSARGREGAGCLGTGIAPGYVWCGYIPPNAPLVERPLSRAAIAPKWMSSIGHGTDAPAQKRAR